MSIDSPNALREKTYQFEWTKYLLPTHSCTLNSERGIDQDQELAIEQPETTWFDQTIDQFTSYFRKRRVSNDMHTSVWRGMDHLEKNDYYWLAIHATTFGREIVEIGNIFSSTGVTQRLGSQRFMFLVSLTLHFMYVMFRSVFG